MIQPARPGMNRANYRVMSVEPDEVLLEDMGPWDRHPTVTNDAEQVVQDMLRLYGGRRILYYDSEDELTELLHDGTRFTGFACPRGQEENEEGHNGV